MKNLKEVDVDNKKVLLRVDFNVPLGKNQEIKDDFRIKSHLETINYLKQNNAKIIIISHLGKPKGKELSLSLKLVAEKLAEITGYNINFAEDCLSDKTNQLIEEMKPGDIILMENVRFYPEEEQNNNQCAASLARMGDIFVNVAFSVSHRNHASIVSIPMFIDSYPGFLLEKEVKTLSNVMQNPQRPFATVIGGAKIVTKTKVIKKLLEKLKYKIEIIPLKYIIFFSCKSKDLHNFFIK